MDATMEDVRTAIEWRQIDPARGRARRYFIVECRSLFGDPGLLVTWGRIGRPTRVRLETFGSASMLAARWRELVSRRNAHGYEIQTSLSAACTERRAPLNLSDALLQNSAHHGLSTTP